MKQVILKGHGGPETLIVEETPIPEPTKGQIRVKIERAGVAYGDVLQRHGMLRSSESTPGYDVVGRVDALGEGVSGLTVGERVFVFCEFGGYSQYVCTGAKRAVKAPEEGDPSELVVLILNYITAQQLIHRMAELPRGAKVLIHSAAGGVGTAFLQLAQLHDLKVYGTASSGKLQLVKDLGGIPIDYKTQNFVEEIQKAEPQGLDAAFDGVGGETLERSRDVLKKGGLLVSFGFQSNFEGDKAKGGIVGVGLSIVKNMIFKGGRRFKFYGINTEAKNDWYHEDMNKILELYQSGKIKPVVGKELPLSEIQEAHRLLQGGGVQGKIVLNCE